jgi:hypothetical protein
MNPTKQSATTNSLLTNTGAIVLLIACLGLVAVIFLRNLNLPAQTIVEDQSIPSRDVQPLDNPNQYDTAIVQVTLPSGWSTSGAFTSTRNSGLVCEDRTSECAYIEVLKAPKPPQIINGVPDVTFEPVAFNPLRIFISETPIYPQIPTVVTAQSEYTVTFLGETLTLTEVHAQAQSQQIDVPAEFVNPLTAPKVAAAYYACTSEQVCVSATGLVPDPNVFPTQIADLQAFAAGVTK